ncbi:maturation protein [ssRNA phage SRR7976299_17]|uniref:Maturation protein n=1 Tax=ssRNA phage SRR7976299_17 TaxID=2786639 RepID=A0A8S5L5H0_9VIRU|nr:maturation protein [ssRNA phage SRR7976299_17]DAD52645.1 TPA_asm: maturation protein [ssRNA phage SRR7976299_17]
MRRRMRDNPRAAAQIGQLLWRRPKGVGPWLVSSTYYNTTPLSSYPYYDLETCVDEIHPGPPYQLGGPLDLWKSRSSCPDVRKYGDYYFQSRDTEFRYVGGFVLGIAPVNGWFTTGSITSLQWPKTLTTSQLASSTFGSISSYGAKAWTKFRPGESIADAAVFIGELTDLPKMLKTTASAFSREYISRFGRRPRKYAKEAANHWLNTQFGWLPFVSDLRKFYRAWKVMDTWYNDLVIHNGQWHKRGGIVKRSTSNSLVANYPDSPKIYPNHYALIGWTPTLPKGGTSITRVARQKVWFEASYRYYVPEIRSVEWRRKAIANLFGADLTPVTVWELTPFSWLVDWFTNIGDIINSSSNTGLFANLATKYAYLMGTTDEVVNVTTFFPIAGTLHRAEWDISLTRKVRKLGGHFGFDLADSGLTARQWSILGALGITRL